MQNIRVNGKELLAINEDTRTTYPTTAASSGGACDSEEYLIESSMTDEPPFGLGLRPFMGSMMMCPEWIKNYCKYEISKQSISKHNDSIASGMTKSYANEG